MPNPTCVTVTSTKNHLYITPESLCIHMLFNLAVSPEQVMSTTPEHYSQCSNKTVMFNANDYDHL